MKETINTESHLIVSLHPPTLLYLIVYLTTWLHVLQGRDSLNVQHFEPQNLQIYQ